MGYSHKKPSRKPQTPSQPIVVLEKGLTLQERGMMSVANRDIVRLGALVLFKQNPKESKPVDEMTTRLTDQQVMYLNLRAEGARTEDICKELQIPRTSVLLWEEDDELFKACMTIVKRMEANDAEESLWHQAKTNPMAKELLMFGLRARKPEYQEGSMLGGLAQTRVEINIGGVKFDPSASLKDAGADPDS